MVRQLATWHISGSDLPWLMALHAPEVYKVQVRTAQTGKAGLFGEVSFSRFSYDQTPHQLPEKSVTARKILPEAESVMGFWARW